MKREEDQQLWDLLGQAPPAELSPFFARDIVRKIRQRPRHFAWLPNWLGPKKLIPMTGLAVAVIAAVLAVRHPVPRNSGDSTPDAILKIDPQDYDVVADLDELLATDESSLWDDDTQTL